MSGGEVHILTGFDAIVNPDNIRSGVDLKALERQMISGGIVARPTQAEKDPADKFSDALQIAAKKLGINFDDVGAKPVQKIQAVQTPQRQPFQQQTPQRQPFQQQTPQRQPFQQQTPQRQTPQRQTPQRQPFQQQTPPHAQETDHAVGYNEGVNNDAGGDENEDNSENSDNSDHGDYRDDTPPSMFAREQPAAPSLMARTLEQERRSHIDSVIGVSNNNVDFSLEKEKKEDLKCSMLAEIDSLITSLSMEEVNLERIPKVNMQSSFNEIETTLKILRHKNDQTRCCTFAEEALMFAAYALEDLFDGKQVWFGRWSPDLTGYHNQMNVKLRRVRYDTGQIVGTLMEDYNIGPGMRIALEIVPNMVLYSKMRKQQHSQPGLSDVNNISDAEVDAASARIRGI